MTRSRTYAAKHEEMMDFALSFLLKGMDVSLVWKRNKRQSLIPLGTVPLRTCCGSPLDDQDREEPE